MPTPAIVIENLSKHYFLGSIGHQTLRELLQSMGRRIKGAPPLEHYKDAHTGRHEAEGPQVMTPKNKRELWALRNINLEINQGETLGIIGRNGAGKSTLLKVLSRITEPTSGRAKVTGKVASLLEVGTGFHPELTGRENIFLNGAVLGMSRKEITKKLEEIIYFSEVERFIDTPVKRYSSGMTVRLAFAVAAHLESDILIVDEVLAVGDSTYQKKCIDKMKDTVKSGSTVLFVSHQLATLKNLCERSILLDHGMLIKDGPSETVISEYLSSSSLSGGQRMWSEAEAPGTEEARLRGIRILSGDKATDQASIDKATAIEIEFDSLAHKTRLSCCIHLMDKTGNVVFVSMNLPSVNSIKDPMGGKPYPKGRFCTRCTIPPNFLNDGYYSVKAFLIKDITHILAAVEDAANFFVVDTGVMRHEYHGAWPGCIRPKMPWTTEHLA